MSQTNLKFWTAVVLLLSSAAATVTLLGGDDEWGTGLALSATILGIITALRHKLEGPRTETYPVPGDVPGGESNRHAPRSQPVPGEDPYGRWWRRPHK